MTKFLAKDRTNLPAIARAILATSNERVLLFYGDMGAGKTTLIKAICNELGVEEQVSSPTFSIVNEYSDGNSPVYHFDFYRLKNEAEALDIGVEDYLYSGYYCLVEWPERISRLLPEQYTKIEIMTIADGSRALHLTIINS